jgi:hypothetical protein
MMHKSAVRSQLNPSPPRGRSPVGPQHLGWNRSVAPHRWTLNDIDVIRPRGFSTRSTMLRVDPNVPWHQFKRTWRQLPLRDRLRVRTAVAYGRAVRDPRLAPYAVALARKWQRSILVRNRFVGLAAWAATLLASAFVILWLDPDSLYMVAVAAVASLPILFLQRGFYEGSEQINRRLMG